MLVVPAMDVLDGKVVRLRQGKKEFVTTYGDVETTLDGFINAGINRVHIVDLNAAFGEDSDLLERLTPYANYNFQIGGGFRSIEKIKNTIQNTNFDVVIGSLLTIIGPDMLLDIDASRIIAALDVIEVDSKFMIQDLGWKRDTNKNLVEIMKLFQNKNLNSFLITDISRDGEMSGPNFKLYEYLQELFPEMKFIVSGGIGSIEDLKALNKTSIHSVVVGKALYEKKISLSEVLAWQQ